MGKNKKTNIIKSQILKNFKKIDVMKERWDNPKLKQVDISKYNKWSLEKWRGTTTIELRLEHYLCDNIKVDLKSKNDLFENIDGYFNKEYQKYQKFESVIEKLKNIAEDSKINILHIRKLTFGQKLIIWNYLKNSIFKNKFLGINKKEQKYLITSLNNVRLMRNGIAHLDSKEQIFKKLRKLDANEKINKEDLYKKSFSIANKMQTTKKHKKENANE